MGRSVGNSNSTRSKKGVQKVKVHHVTPLEKLKAHLQHQQVLWQQAQDNILQEQELHAVLADGICTEKVLYDLLLPLHQQWLQLKNPPAGNDAEQAAAVSLNGASAGIDWGALLPLVRSANPLLSAMMQATPQQVQAARMITPAAMIDTHSKLFSELVVLLELVCPQRYNGQQHQGAKLPSSAGGSSACQLGQGENKPHEAAAAALQEICCNDTTMLESETQGIAAARAAAQERLIEVIREANIEGCLICLHNPAVLLEAAATNLAIKQPGVAPMGHFVKAAERLGLTRQQLLHLRLMLQQYNKSMQALLLDGLELLKLSNESTSLQVAAATISADRDSTSTPFGSGGASAAAEDQASAGAAGPACGDIAHNGSNHSRQSSGLASSMRGSSAEASETQQQQQQQLQGVQGKDTQNKEEEEPADAADDLAARMQKHMRDRTQVMVLLGFWVINTLSPVQVAKFIVYCWPYYICCSALAEVAALMPLPDEDEVPPPELHDFMEQRRAGMQRELAWLVEHASELAGTSL